MATEDTGLEASKNFNLGDRVKTKGGLAGTIRYIGKVGDNYNVCVCLYVFDQV